MVDTIVLRIHDLKKHGKLLRKMSTISRTHFYKKKKDYNTALVPSGSLEGSHLAPNIQFDKESFSLINTDTGEVVSELVNSNPVISLNVYRNENDTRVWKSGSRGQIQLPSSHYSVAFNVDEGKDYIDINFSIPKYIYSTNVFQFVPHFNHKGFVTTRNDRFNHNCNVAFSRLNKFIRLFFKKNLTYIDKGELKPIPIDFTSVEINRIDLCYNQVFASEKDARYYLQNLKEIRKKNIRENSRVRVNPQNGNIMYISDNYSAKIYHKGDDFRLHDMKQILKVERETGRHVADVEKIEKFADRILRYEITFRKGYFSYLFFQNLFRKNSSRHADDKKRYNQIRRDMELLKLSPVELRKRKKPPYTHDQINITRPDKTFYKEFTRTVNQRLNFMVDYDDSTYFDTPMAYNVIPDRNIKFSKSLFLLLCGKLSDFVQEFKLENRVSFVELTNRVRNLNADIDKYRKQALPVPLMKDDPRKGAKIKTGALLGSLVMLMESGKTFDSVCDSLNVPKRTRYDYKRQLKRLGFSDKSVLPVDIEVDTSFKEYHKWCTIYMRNALPFIFGKRTH